MLFVVLGIDIVLRENHEYVATLLKGATPSCRLH